jgi:chitodextrinase
VTAHRTCRTDRTCRTASIRLGALAVAVTLLSALGTTTALAAKKPGTVLDTKPAANTTSTSATFTFHGTLAGSTFSCRLDSGSPVACNSLSITYQSLTASTHTFVVTATAGGVIDPSPTKYTWTIDLTAPTAPTSLAATTPTATSVTLTWAAGTDNRGVTGNDVYRDGTKLASIGPVTTYTDSAVAAGSTHTYAVLAKDAAGNLSPLSAPLTVTASSGTTYDPHLTRPPYLTDLVGTGVTVNFGTDRSTTTASVQYGAVGAGGACTLTGTVDATKIVVAVGTINEYQWMSRLELPAAGSYCYRPFLGSTDLLGTGTSPVFTTQVPAGSTEPYSFAVFGDWGQAYAAPGNTNQSRLLAQLATSGVRFAITTGDNGYPSGSQLNYGDLQQSGADISGIFGPGQWGVPGASIPLFPTIGNHGLARNDAIHPHFGIWPQPAAVATSGGSYERTSYPSINGSTAASYPSPWYAFDAGNARFYILDAAWADLNGGTAGVYSTEATAHWQPGAAQYEWLKHDLEAHQSGLKFAFFHYPLYSDQPDESSDTSLQGPSSLEGLLVANGVSMAFQGHAHIYQRSTGLGGLATYVTGGGGAKAQSTGACSANDLYAVGWSYTRSVGTRCGSAPAPTSDAQVYHFLKVTVNGRQVTVTPTDSAGRTFDVQTYSFDPPPETFIDNGPPAGSASTSATFAFHASGPIATYTCALDSAPAAACTSPVTYNGLGQGPHTLAVTAKVGALADPTPATWSWTADTVAPSAPSSITADAPSPFRVDISWPTASDNTGVTGYDLYKDGDLLAALGVVTSYSDDTVLASTTHDYAVRARDVAGNVSEFVSATVTTPTIAAPVFADTFESGGLSGWTTKAGLTVQGTTVHGGAYAAEGATTNGGTYAKVTLPSTYGDAWSRVWFDVVSQTDQVNLLRLRDQAGASLGYAYVNAAGKLGFHDDATGTNTVSATSPGTGWHALELHLLVGSAPGDLGTVEVWLDNVRIADLSSAAVDVGSTPVGALQIGEVQTGLVYDVVFDDVAFGTSRIGPSTDNSPPSVPQDVAGTAQSTHDIQVTWSAATDNVSVASYDVFRDGVLLVSVDAPTVSYDDATVQPSTTYSYTVRARDTSGNVSEPSAPGDVTTPGTAAPLFADGFETGDLSAWSSTNGLVVNATTVHSGSFAAESSSPTTTMFARKTLPATYTDAYAAVAFRVTSLGSQTTLLRLRDTAGGTAGGGYLVITAGGNLGYRDPVGGAPTASLGAVTTNTWHQLELHILMGASASDGTVEVWLDGTRVMNSAGINVGTAAIGVLQIGDTAPGTNRDYVFDDAAFSTSRLGT